MLGKSLFSFRVVPISIYSSCASFFLFTFLTFGFAKNPGQASRREAFFWFLVFLGLALVPTWLKDKWALGLWWSIIPAAIVGSSGFLVFAFRTLGARSTLRGIGLVMLIFVSSLFFDLIYIVFTRYVLRRISRIDRIPEICLMAVGNLLVLGILFLGPIYGGLALAKHAPQAGAMVLVSFPLNSVDLVAGFAALCLAVLLLLHRLFWPTIQRPVYAICRFSPIREKKWWCAVGGVLLLLPRHLTVEGIRAILEKLF